MRSVETVVLTAAEIAADNPHILSTQLVFNSTTGQLRVGPGTWAQCLPAKPHAEAYTALLSQTGTDAPVATVLENSLGAAVVWTRNSEGIYVGTLEGAFPAGKVVLDINLGQASAGYDARIVRASDDEVAVYTLNAGSAADALLNGSAVRILVYP